jgi:hypothetical protein
VSDDLCGSNADCVGDGLCTFTVSDRDRSIAACFVQRDPFGMPTDSLPPGAACDPASDAYDTAAVVCEEDVDCAGAGATWECTERRLGRSFRDYHDRVCQAPTSERCALVLGVEGLEPGRESPCRDPRYCGCLAEGRCGGLCTSDEDCGADMRCSQIEFSALEQDLDERFDDTLQTAGFCSYASGSRTACVREGDCATTGVGGARETCKVGMNAAGDVAAICVTPAPSVVLPGDACGDDPATPEVELRTCVNACLAGRCAGACESDADCPSGSSCLDHFIDEVSTSGLCTPLAPSCDRDADCAAGEVCRLMLASDGAHRVCGPAVGEIAAGGLCKPKPYPATAPALHCRSLGCERTGTSLTAGRCSTLCLDDGDCPTDYHCSSREETIQGFGTLDRSDDATATWRQCEKSEGSRADCRTNADCPMFEVCVATTDADGVQLRQCMTDPGLSGSLGDSCNAGCSSRLCVQDWRSGYQFCSVLCDSDADCGETGLVCRRFLGDRLNVDRTLCVAPDDPRGETL